MALGIIVYERRYQPSFLYHLLVVQLRIITAPRLFYRHQYRVVDKRIYQHRSLDMVCDTRHNMLTLENNLHKWCVMVGSESNHSPKVCIHNTHNKWVVLILVLIPLPKFGQQIVQRLIPHWRIMPQWYLDHPVLLRQMIRLRYQLKYQ